MKCSIILLVVTTFSAQSLYAANLSDKGMGELALPALAAAPEVAVPVKPEAPQYRMDASQAVFKGHSRWTKSGYSEFSPLEQLGVQRSAENDAVLACQEAGHDNCVPLNSKISTCNGFACEADALAGLFTVSAGAAIKVFKGQSEWKKSSYSEFSPLEQLGVEKSAEDKAVMNCQSEGLSGCAGFKALVASCNGFSCQGEALAKGYTAPQK